jgi:hypothetical protein
MFLLRLRIASAFWAKVGGGSMNIYIEL